MPEITMVKKVGIIGGAGYTGGELIRILLKHPFVTIDFIHSRSQSGKPIYHAHTDLLGDTTLHFTDKINPDIDIAFLCLPHGKANEFIELFSADTCIIDLSQDFRVQSHSERNFVYGLPELFRNSIAKANTIANPGCFATAIQLSLLPLLKRDISIDDIHVHCTTGSTGAGMTLSDTGHFSWRSNNLSVYKAFEHQHLHEIHNTIQQFRTDLPSIRMIPQRGPFTRGILSCMTMRTNQSNEIASLFKQHYEHEPFVYISDTELDIKQVVNTNKCFIHIQCHEDTVLITAVIDNLIKGASGQAIQNMNIMLGLPETTGLQLKASAY
jgi:N-acetyl-gamma-glutamyl-phosphate reductase